MMTWWHDFCEIFGIALIVVGVAAITGLIVILYQVRGKKK